MLLTKKFLALAALLVVGARSATTECSIADIANVASAVDCGVDRTCGMLWRNLSGHPKWPVCCTGESGTIDATSGGSYAYGDEDTPAVFQICEAQLPFEPCAVDRNCAALPGNQCYYIDPALDVGAAYSPCNAVQNLDDSGNGCECRLSAVVTLPPPSPSPPPSTTPTSAILYIVLGAAVVVGVCVCRNVRIEVAP